MYVNGTNAKITVIGAYILLVSMIAAITAIVITGNTVPEEFSFMAATLVGALAGFLTGTRVVPPDVSAQLKRLPLNDAEKEILADKV